MRLPLHALSLAGLAGLAAPAQEPKLGTAWYEDETDLGFRIRSPKSWSCVAGDDPNVIGVYTPREKLALGGEAYLRVQILLLKLDRRERAKPSATPAAFTILGHEDVDSWMKRGLDEGQGWQAVEASRPFPCDVPGASVSIYEGLSTGEGFEVQQKAEPKPVRAYVARYPLGPELDVAFVGLGPGGKKWSGYEKAFSALAKTLQPRAKDAAPGSPEPPDERRTELLQEIARAPGWSLRESPGILLLSSCDDARFLEELEQELARMRAVLEEDLPFPEDGRSRSRVVRLFQERGAYAARGGDPRAAACFQAAEEELLLVAGPELGASAWRPLRRAGLQQHLGLLLGPAAPHRWLAEGLGDYYAGHEPEQGRLAPRPAAELQREVRALIGAGRHAPLDDFVRWTPDEFDGRVANRGNGRAGGPLTVEQCRAQAWSLVWFLRTGSERTAGWQEAWASILDRYLGTLLETGSAEKAVDAAFRGVDWKVLEVAWLDYSR